MITVLGLTVSQWEVFASDVVTIASHLYSQHFVGVS